MFAADDTTEMDGAGYIDLEDDIEYVGHDLMADADLADVQYYIRNAAFFHDALSAMGWNTLFKKYIPVLPQMCR